MRGLGVVVVASLLVHAASVSGQDKYVGALWKYELTPVSGKSEPMKGLYRVEDGKIYQPREGKPTLVGTIERNKEYSKGNLPKKGDKERVAFSDLSGNNQTKFIKAKGPIVFERFGEVRGRLIDSTGAHWDFKASRVQE